MLRSFAIAAAFALAVSTSAMAQGGPPGHGHGHPGARPGPVHPGGPPRGPHMGGPNHPGPYHPGSFVFHGHPFAWHHVHFPHPWAYPPGYGYRLWVAGAILPPIFWHTSTYYYTGWAGLGLPPPNSGFQYVEYGPDLLLVNVSTGEVVQVFPGAFY